jgi:hypothetical protein
MKNYIELFKARLKVLGLDTIQADAVFESIRIENPNRYIDLEKSVGSLPQDLWEWLWSHVAYTAAAYLCETEGEEYSEMFWQKLESYEDYKLQH